MEQEIILQDLEENIEQYSRAGIEQNLQDLLSVASDEEVCIVISQLLLKKYTSMRSGFFAQVVQDIFRVKPELGIIRFPDNYFFSLSVLRGSFDIYECYLEEVIEPLLKGESEEKWEQVLSELLNIAQQYNEKVLDNYKPVIKGVNYNGVFSEHETLPDVLNIKSEDYWAMENVIENYNSILGSRDIIKDLEKRFEKIDIE